MSFTGPPLPPHLKDKLDSNHENSGVQKIDIYDEPEEFGPQLPPHMIKQSSSSKELVHSAVGPIGATIPPSTPKIPSEPTNDEYERTNTFGPELPPHLKSAIGPSLPLGSKGEDGCQNNLQIKEAAESSVFGPDLPPHLQHRQLHSNVPRLLGPELPPSFVPPQDSSEESSEEEEVFGPDPRLQADGDTAHDIALDRMKNMKNKSKSVDEKVERETWMLELPPETSGIFGTGPRKFRAKLAPEMGDRSVWTDTPTDSARKQGAPPPVDEKELMRKNLIAKRDKEMEKLARKAEKKLKRKESLLESHQKELKKKKKDEEERGPKERKRFNREEDLQVNRFDEAQKKQIMKRAQLLNDRFSKGESKYL